MGILSRLFGRQQSPSGTTGEGWYLVARRAKSLRQIVFELNGEAPVDSRFDNLVLKPDKYSGLLSDLAVGFFKMETSDPRPYLLIKTPSFSRAMAHEVVRIGFTFCYMPSCPVFAIFAQSPTTERELKVKGGCFIDQVYSIDKHSGLDDLITEAFSRNKLTVVFAESGGMFGTQCILDAEYHLDRSLQETYDKEWSDLCTYGNKIDGWGHGSFSASREELYERTPIDKSPII